MFGLFALAYPSASSDLWLRSSSFHESITDKSMICVCQILAHGYLKCRLSWESTGSNWTVVSTFPMQHRGLQVGGEAAREDTARSSVTTVHKGEVRHHPIIPVAVQAVCLVAD